MTSTDRTLAPAVTIAPPVRPVLTVLILLVLLALFAAEIAYGTGTPSDSLQPTIATLIAFG